MTALRTARLVLRRARPSDLDAMHAVLRDERAMTYWSHPPHADLERTRAWLDAMIQSPPELSDDFVITLDGRPIGKIGAWRLPDFGYILSPDHWGQGYAGEAMTAFLDHVFARPDIDHLTADVDPRNKGSIALLERFGFTETGRGTGTWDTHIGLCDSIYFRLDREAWLKPG